MPTLSSAQRHDQESAARPSANVAPMVTGLMEFSSHSVTEGHDGGGAPGVSGASNRKDSTPDVAGDCCAPRFQAESDPQAWAIVRKVIEYRRVSTGGMLCSQTWREAPVIT